MHSHPPVESRYNMTGFRGGPTTFSRMFLVPIKIHRWLAVALEEAESPGTSGPEPATYHILTVIFFFLMGWVFWGCTLSSSK